MPQQFCPIDFEFNDTLNKDLNLVCAAYVDPNTDRLTKSWLHRRSKAQADLKKRLAKIPRFMAYAVPAEARSFLTLGLNPLDFEWIDLHLEYRMISNHNDNINWGKQLQVKTGKIVTAKKPKPKWERVEGEDQQGFKPTFSLAEATYKLTGKIRDTRHKNLMRDLIISSPKEFTADEGKAILDYCADDVIFLEEIWTAIKAEMKRLLGHEWNEEKYIEEAIVRGRYAAHTAIMEANGYPVDIEKVRNFANAVPVITHELQSEINDLFPDIRPFKWKKNLGRFTWDQLATRGWIKKNHDVKDWVKTDTNELSLALDSWTRFYDFKHDYPTDNFGAQMVRYLKTIQALKGFKKIGETKTRSFFEYVGPDDRVRCYFNIYGAQSSRSQPAASGFMFLKPAWLRVLVQPKPGRFLAGIDYGSEEFFIAALRANDQNMIQAYLSGDPYLAFGKLVNLIPPDGTKKTHSRERDLCKSTVLGLSYLMSKYGLAIKLSNDTGRTWDEDEAQEQIDLFYEAFSDLGEYQKQIIADYEEYGYVRLPCGWYCWGDNDNFRSVTNIPSQGEGASIMRKAVDLAVAEGLQIAFTLHDAIYIEGDVGNEKQIVKLRDCMRDAFTYYMPKELKDTAAMIRLDPHAWSPDYPESGELDFDGWKVPITDKYIDKRAQRDYDRFSKYFDTPDSNLL